MTAEIAIMNRLAIALAADSAVTIGSVSDVQAGKIFNTVNKLFTLSKVHPVGIMIYGRADLDGVPWEILIKEYRKELRDQCFQTLEMYAEDFIRFLTMDTLRIPPEFQDMAFQQQSYAYLTTVKNSINQKVADKFQANCQVDEAVVLTIIDDTVSSESDKWNAASFLLSADEDFLQSIMAKYDKSLNDLLSAIFEKLPCSEANKEILKRCCASIPCKDLFNEEQKSGVVIAGFGAEDIFPSIVEIGIELRVMQQLKYRKIKTAKISSNIHAQIVPFAQAEMVSAFMEGIDPQFKKFNEGYLSSILPKIPNLLFEVIDIDKEKRSELEGKMKAFAETLMAEYQKQIGLYSRNQHIQPVLNIVTLLPKDELAEMAETLVSLTSFKKKVSPVAETVGGPIDVALITKGDGFVWIKRKHYFKPELNAQFFSNYNR
jgi:hypothetical protein